MSRKSKVKLFKILLAILVVAILIVSIMYFFPVMKNLSTLKGQLAFKQKVEESGIIGMLLLFGLQVAQIFLFIIPGEPIEIIAGMCYGEIWGTVFIMVTSSLISITIFMLVKKFGRKFVYDFCDKKSIAKIEENKLFQNPKKIELILFLLFLIPGTPKDLLVYLSGLLPIRTVRFFVITTIARIPSIITSTLAGAHIIYGRWKIGIMLYAGIFLAVLVFLFFIKKLDKSKTTEKILNMKIK